MANDGAVRRGAACTVVGGRTVTVGRACDVRVVRGNGPVRNVRAPDIEFAVAHARILHARDARNPPLCTLSLIAPTRPSYYSHGSKRFRPGRRGRSRSPGRVLQAANGKRFAFGWEGGRGRRIKNENKRTPGARSAADGPCTHP